MPEGKTKGERPSQNVFGKKEKEETGPWKESLD